MSRSVYWSQKELRSLDEQSRFSMARDFELRPTTQVLWSTNQRYNLCSSSGRNTSQSDRRGVKARSQQKSHQQLGVKWNEKWHAKSNQREQPMQVSMHCSISSCFNRKHCHFDANLPSSKHLKLCLLLRWDSNAPDKERALIYAKMDAHFVSHLITYSFKILFSERLPALGCLCSQWLHSVLIWPDLPTRNGRFYSLPSVNVASPWALLFNWFKEKAKKSVVTETFCEQWSIRICWSAMLQTSVVWASLFLSTILGCRPVFGGWFWVWGRSR